MIKPFRTEGLFLWPVIFFYYKRPEWSKLYKFAGVLICLLEPIALLLLKKLGGLIGKTAQGITQFFLLLNAKGNRNGLFVSIGKDHMTNGQCSQFL